MKNKKIVYILLPVVLIVWGVIIYKIIGYTSDDGNYAYTPKTVKIDSSLYIQDTIVYDLLLSYQDPFLKKRYRKTTVKNESSKKNKPTKSPKKNKPKKDNWINVKYSGVIENSNSKDMVALVDIRGEMFMLKEGEEAHNYTLKSITKDSVQMAYEEEVKYIKK